MEVCFGRGLVPSIAAVMELVPLAVAAGVGVSAAIESWRRRLKQEWSFKIWRL